MKQLEHLLGMCGEAHINLYHVLIVAVCISMVYVKYKKRKV